MIPNKMLKAAMAELPNVDTDEVRRALEAALEAAQSGWYNDASDIWRGPSLYETPDDALQAAELSLGQIVRLDRCVEVSTDEWQLVPVTSDGELCPCGKPGGCGDFLGVDCEADWDAARRVEDLPEQWRQP